MFIAALVLIAKMREQPRYPSVGDWNINLDNGIFIIQW